MSDQAKKDTRDITSGYSHSQLEAMREGRRFLDNEEVKIAAFLATIDALKAERLSWEKKWSDAWDKAVKYQATGNRARNVLTHVKLTIENRKLSPGEVNDYIYPLICEALK